MRQPVFTIRPDKGSDGRHRPATGTEPVAGPREVHMPRVQADRAVIAVSPAAGNRPDQRAAVPTAKLFRLIGALPTHRRACALLIRFIPSPM